MNMMHGADFLPCSNMSRTRLAPTPTNISTKSEPLMEKKPQQEQGDRQETNHGLREHVGFRVDGGLHAGRSEFFLQIVRETQIHGGSKRHRLRWRWPYSLTDVSPAQCLRWPAVLYHQL